MDLAAAVLCQFWPAVSVEDTDGVGIEGLELVAGESVLAGVVCLVLRVLDAVIDEVPLQLLVRLGQRAGGLASLLFVLRLALGLLKGKRQPAGKDDFGQVAVLVFVSHVGEEWGCGERYGQREAFLLSEKERVVLERGEKTLEE